MYRYVSLDAVRNSQSSGSKHHPGHMVGQVSLQVTVLPRGSPCGCTSQTEQVVMLGPAPGRSDARFLRRVRWVLCLKSQYSGAQRALGTAVQRPEVCGGPGDSLGFGYSPARCLCPTETPKGHSKEGCGVWQWVVLGRAGTESYLAEHPEGHLCSLSLPPPLAGPAHRRQLC